MIGWFDDLESCGLSEDQDDSLPSCQWSSRESTPNRIHQAGPRRTSPFYCSASTVSTPNSIALQSYVNAPRRSPRRSPRLLARTKLDPFSDNEVDSLDDSLQFCQWSSPENSTPTIDSPIRNIHTNTESEGYNHLNYCSTPIRNIELRSTVTLRCSPRLRPDTSAKAKFDPSNVVKDAGSIWQLSKVMELNGCNPCCASKVHGLTEYDILLAHSMFSSKKQHEQYSMFSSKKQHEQRTWLLEYFATHCPNNKAGERDFKSINFMLCGKTVCQLLWQAIISVSTSRFYDLRKSFIEDTYSLDYSNADKKSKQKAAKSMRSIEWMRSYFDRVGDKRPDKDGIYLPSCLTRQIIYNNMIDEVSDSDESGEVICFSQFNKLFTDHFPNVSIPKVRCSYVCTYRQL